VTGCPDAYAEVKRLANEKALALLPRLKALVDAASPEERLRTVIKISCVGNVIEYDVPGHSSDIDDALGMLDDDLFIDDTDEFKGVAGPGSEVLILADNAGEIALDRLLVRELRRMGCRVTVAVKGRPSLNDALLGDVVEVGMEDEADEVVTTGTDAIGVRHEECSGDFLERFYGAEVIVSKGMANWETLTEVPAPCPVLYVFLTKCGPIAESRARSSWAPPLCWRLCSRWLRRRAWPAPLRHRGPGP